MLDFFRGMTLHDVLSILEEEEPDNHKAVEISILPPVNCNGDITDEDSGDEEHCSLNNLPATQLQAEAEIQVQDEVDPGITGKLIFTQSEPIPSTSNRQEKTQSVPLYPSEPTPPSRLRSKSKSSLPKYNKTGNLFKWKDGDLIIDSEIEWPLMLTVAHNQTPQEIFEQFFDLEVIEMLVEQTNRYAATHNKLGDVSENEMKCFIGILLLSGYNPLPRRRLFWEGSKDTHNELVASTMSRDRFEFIMSNLHCCNNYSLNIKDKFAKIRPLYDKLNVKFQEFLPHVQYHSIDEAMVPYFGRHGCKQFLKGKTIRYGYKLWVGATNTGYVSWIEPYQGASTYCNEKYRELGVGPAVILSYADILSSISDLPYHLVFDNYFTTVALLKELTKRKLKGTGTIRCNRVSMCPLMENSVLKKKGRGSFHNKVTVDNSIVICKWNDNSIVTVASNAVPVAPFRSVPRYSVAERKKININQPNMINVYNKNMKGVDRSDENIGLYRIAIRGKKWYVPLIFHAIDTAVQNAWQLHKIQGGKLDQLHFRRRIVLAYLVSKKQHGSKRCRPSSLENIDTRYDRIDHIVVSQGKQTRCRNCHKKVSTKCKKCDVALHINCFEIYHTKI